jgi:DNA invertase Pin-like site-specific DNA recombinase
MTKKPRGERGCAYLRVSTENQDTTSQRAPIEAFLGGKAVQRWYVDEGGRRHRAEKREHFQKLLHDVAAGRWDWCVVDTQDRLGFKHDPEYKEFVNHFIRHGCELWEACTGTLLSDPCDELAVLKGTIGSLKSAKDQRDLSYKITRGQLRAAREGRWLGGNVPFGFDVGVFGPDGTEKWRIVQVSRERRLKVWPDGRQEEYIGRKNSPKYDDTDTAHLVLSKDKSRVEAARQVFVWFATEDLATHLIAKRLNALGIRPYYGDHWTHRSVQDMLRNPVYVGRPAWNKEAQGHFWQVKGGQFVPTPWERNEPVPEGRRQEGDFVWLGSSVPPVVDQATWDRVQAKLSRSKGGRRPPRSAELWLKRFMVCGHCGRLMRSIHGRKNRIGKQYYCASWHDERLHGTGNPKGCRRHPIDHDIVERIVEDYLRGTELRLEKAEEKPELLEALDKELDQSWRERLGVFDSMRNFVLSVLDQREGFEDVEEELDRMIHGDLVALYRELYEREQNTLTVAMAEKERQFEDMVEKFAQLTSKKAIDLANQKMEALEREIDELKARLEPLCQRQEQLYNEIGRLHDALAGARKALRGEEGRKKAEAVARVIDRVICYYRHTDGRGRNPSSVPRAVVIVPKVGEAKAYELDEKLLELWVAPSPHKKQGTPLHDRHL